MEHVTRIQLLIWTRRRRANDGATRLMHDELCYGIRTRSARFDRVDYEDILPAR